MPLEAHSTPGKQSDNITVKVDPPIELDPNKRYELALTQLNAWNSVFNIDTDAGYNNNTIAYRNTAGDWKTVVFPDGNWQIENLQAYLTQQMDLNGDLEYVDDEPHPDIILGGNYQTMKCFFIFTNDFAIDLTLSNFNELIGFDKGVYEDDTEGQYQVDITRGVNAWGLHCDLVEGALMNGKSSELLYSFRPNAPPASAITIIPPHLIYVPLKNFNMIRSFNVRILDQLQRRLDLNGEPVSVMLNLREIPTSNIAE